MRRRKFFGMALRKRYGHAKGKRPLKLLERQYAKLGRIIRARGGKA